MKIAQISPLYERVPPLYYGGSESFPISLRNWCGKGTKLPFSPAATR